MTAMRLVGVKFEHEDVDEIDKQAKRLKLDRSGFIRMATLTQLSQLAKAKK